ncbi:hypothetical protein KW786_04050 [Candidatus Parcubacteria bacterium]|nr:hypothetical protein [Candidatus Parcubacteria bacterium]
METGILIKSVVLVGVVLGVLFASQQAFFTKNVKDYSSSQGSAGNQYLEKAKGWFSENVYPRGSGGGSGAVQLPDVTTIAKTEIEKQKKNLAQNSLDATKIFLAKEALDVLGVKAEDLAKCPVN